MTKPSDYWYTPDYVLGAVNAFMTRGWFDPCPIAPAQDGLTTRWDKRCFINPPYSNPLRSRFIDKGWFEFTQCGESFLWLLNFGNNKDSAFLHRHASAVCIPEKRIKFVPGHPALGNGNSPRYDSIFVLWGETEGFEEAFSKIGKVYFKPSKGSGYE